MFAVFAVAATVAAVTAEVVPVFVLSCVCPLTLWSAYSDVSLFVRSFVCLFVQAAEAAVGAILAAEVSAKQARDAVATKCALVKVRITRIDSLHNQPTNHVAPRCTTLHHVEQTTTTTRTDAT